MVEPGMARAEAGEQGRIVRLLLHVGLRTVIGAVPAKPPAFGPRSPLSGSAVLVRRRPSVTGARRRPASTPRLPPDRLPDGGTDHGSDDHVTWVVHAGVDAGVADGAGEQGE